MAIHPLYAVAIRDLPLQHCHELVLESGDVGAHDLSSALAITRFEGRDDVPVLFDRFTESADFVKRVVPQSEDVVVHPIQSLHEKLVMRCACQQTVSRVMELNQ